MRQNSFKELEKLEMEQINFEPHKVQNAIASDIGFFRHITSIVELFFPKIMDLFVSLSGGNPDGHSQSSNQSKYPDMN